jgi:hypothetical protein
MATPIPAAPLAGPAPAQRLERAPAALTAYGFSVEIVGGQTAPPPRVPASKT